LLMLVFCFQSPEGFWNTKSHQLTHLPNLIFNRVLPTTGSGTHPASSPMSTRDTLAGAWSLPLTTSAAVKKTWICTCAPSYVFPA
jgi:hypothetical protein